jgi:hypothetical protein
MAAVMLRDACGVTIPPGIPGYSPVLASGIKLTDAATGGDHTQTLTDTDVYVVMADTTAGGAWLLGVADVTTAANALWFVPVGGMLAFRMPQGYTTLHYEALANGASLYIAKLDDNMPPTGMTGV